MPEDRKKVAYLFGAGATHAELLYIDPDLDANARGLLISNVSERVIRRARRDHRYIKDVETVSGAGGSLNIELLISLIENSKIHEWANKTATLKRMVEADITGILAKYKKRDFALHKALLEFHGRRAVGSREELTGLLSLNYDDVLDEAYRSLVDRKINYCFSLDGSSRAVPFLKLHGSFNWKKQFVISKRRTVEIIPLGSSKSYVHAPYGLIWSRALEIITRCDILRVVGCSMSPNDFHLIDLLFKAHLESARVFDLEIVDFDTTGDAIRGNYGFFPRIRRLNDLGVPSTSVTGPKNPFRTWLQYKAYKMLSARELRQTEYLRRLF